MIQTFKEAQSCGAAFWFSYVRKLPEWQPQQKTLGFFWTSLTGRIWTRTSTCKFTNNLKRSISCVWCGVCVCFQYFTSTLLQRYFFLSFPDNIYMYWEWKVLPQITAFLYLILAAVVFPGSSEDRSVWECLAQTHVTKRCSLGRTFMSAAHRSMTEPVLSN